MARVSREGARSRDGESSPDAMLGAWAAWMEAASGRAGAGWADPSNPWWRMPAANAARLPSPAEFLANNPVLLGLDQVLNANPLREVVPVDWAAVAAALRTVWLRSLGNPAGLLASTAELNLGLWRSAFEAWNGAARRWWGLEAGEDRAADKRFAAPEWQMNPAYRSLRDAYLLASDWLLRQGRDGAGDLPEAERRRLDFHLRQFVDAMSPTLLLASNPAALKRAMETGGASLADGFRNLLADLKSGRLSMVDATAFAPGRNLALSPGKVVMRNRLVELIQYAPATPTAHAVPLLIVPPWINKFYILDLQPANSLVRHLVAQGFTVFMLSWKNPDAAMEETGFEDYMELGPLAASDAVREITGAPAVNVMGYCIGGTLLATTLAWLAAKGDARFRAATFMVTLLDFSRVGDTAVFMDDAALGLVEQQMMQRGYLDGREMSNMFNLLRSNDLIWSNVVNNYLMGQRPAAFDLLYWNSDATRMARAAHAWYLRNTYAENNLVKPGRVRLKGVPIDLGRIALDAYAVGAERDHIVPWDAAWAITRILGGRTRFVLASSGHIAGIINPPGGKGTYWTSDAVPPPDSAEGWRRGATRHDGSWWGDWTAWLAERSGERAAPPPLGSQAHPPLADAPGTYVLER